MKITGLEIRNYRSIESIVLTFPSFYTAICGKNDSGKTNLVRAVRSLMREEGPFYYGDEIDFSLKEDYPKWKAKSSGTKEIEICLKLSVNRNLDTGLFQFLTTYLKLESATEDIDFQVQSFYRGEESKNTVKVTVAGKSIDPLESQEVLKKLQASQVFLFHNSTEFSPRYVYRRGYGATLGDISGEVSSQMDNVKKLINKNLKKMARQQQNEITELLGRLESKYAVGLSLPTIDPGIMPFNVTLGDRKIDVDLDNWGSGTRNRTLILMTLFRARKIVEKGTSASKITPVIVVEEPESFLHPSAQAEFGRVLQDISEEFKVQVITTTHSSYLLSQKRPESNILLDRKVVRHRMQETIRVNTTGENWMRPFGEALGIDNKEFLVWRDVFFNPTQSILLVEGETDKEYFDMLRDACHGANTLSFTGEIFPYGGCGSLKNTVLLRFIKNRYKKIFITYDLDYEHEVDKLLQPLGLQKGKHYLGIGSNTPGKKNIEGLLPESVKKAVNGLHHDLVDQVMSGEKDDRETARSRLKRLYLEEFKQRSIPGDEFFKGFYPVVRTINRALIG